VAENIDGNLMNTKHAEMQLEMEDIFNSASEPDGELALADDCETFSRVRSEHQDWYSAGEGNSTAPGLGGGNLSNRPLSIAPNAENCGAGIIVQTRNVVIH